MDRDLLRTTRALFLVLLAAVGARMAAGQCNLVWSGGLGGGPSNVLRDVAVLPGGGFVVAGQFSMVGAMPAHNVAVWKEGVWSTLGPSWGSVPFAVNSVVVMPNGDIVVGGHPSQEGLIARWEGSAWHSIGGIPGQLAVTWIDHMIAMPNGDLVVAGRFYAPYPWLARWDGTSWSSLGDGGWESINALALAHNGDLLVAYNQPPGARVMRWDGATWTQLGSGSSDWRIYALHVGQNGELFAGGQFPVVASWNGSQWTPIGNPQLFFPGNVWAIERLPNGDIIAAGTHYPFPPGNNIARWNGSAWQLLGSGVLQNGNVEAFVLGLATLADARIAVVGDFVMANGSPAPYLAMLSSTCPANATSYGSGCPGTAGQVILVATQWPMLAGGMHGRTTGLTTNSLAVGVFGFSQINVPLSSGHPLGLPGCNVLVADEILIQFMVGTGAVESSIDVPNNSNLIGSIFHHQVVPVELDANGSIQALTSSNALTLTIGSF